MCYIWPEVAIEMLLLLLFFKLLWNTDIVLWSPQVDMCRYVCSAEQHWAGQEGKVGFSVCLRTVYVTIKNKYVSCTNGKNCNVDATLKSKTAKGQCQC